MADSPWCQIDGNTDTSLIITYWILILCWVFNIILGCYGSYRLFINSKAKRKLFKNLYVLISICFFISPPGFAFGLQSGWECWFGDNFYLWEGIYMFGTNGYMFGMALLYLFFWTRLQIVFEQTSMKLSKSMKILFAIFLVVQIITAALSTYYFMLGWNQIVRESALMYFSICAWTNIFASFLVLIVFIKQILSVIIFSERQKQIAIMRVTAHSNSCQGKTRLDTNESTQSIDISNDNEGRRPTITNQNRMKILKLIIRCMICAMVALISTILIATFSTMQSTIPDWHSNLAMRGAHLALRVFDETINLVCLCLQFPFGKGLYMVIFGKIDEFVTKRVMMRISIKTQLSIV